MLIRCNGPSCCSAAPGDAAEAIPGRSEALCVCGVPACGASGALEAALALYDRVPSIKLYCSVQVYPLGSWLGNPLCGLPGTGIPFNQVGHLHASCKHICIDMHGVECQVSTRGPSLCDELLSMCVPPLCRLQYCVNLPCCMAGLPGNLRGGIATVMFQLPVVRHNYAWAGCMPAGAPAPRLASTAVALVATARTVWQQRTECLARARRLEVDAAAPALAWRVYQRHA